MSHPRTEAAQHAINDFVDAILHGDKQHRDWLLAAAQAFKKGEPLPKQPTGHHINEDGEFQSDKYPHLQADKILINFRNPASHAALAALAQTYLFIEPELAHDIWTRLQSVTKHPHFMVHALSNAEKTAPIILKLMGGDA